MLGGSIAGTRFSIHFEGASTWSLSRCCPLINCTVVSTLVLEVLNDDDELSERVNAFVTPCLRPEVKGCNARVRALKAGLA